MSKPHGIWPMLYAFFDGEGRLDRRAFRQQIDWCLGTGCHGIAMLGLITEISFLTPEERQTLVEWAVEDIAGRAPLLVTLRGADREAMTSQALAARALGADFLVMQPPPMPDPTPARLLEFFSAVMAAVPGDIGIQNAPEFMGIGLDAAGVTELNRRHPHFTLMKGEGPVVNVKPFVDALPQMQVFNGRGGLELVDNLIAGCAGMIPAPETLDIQVRIYEAVRTGDIEAAKALYARLLPYAVFSMQSIPVAIQYGKRAFIRRTGIDNAGACRTTKVPADPFFDAAAQRWLSLLVG